jgi:hypothetical protein
MTDKDNSIDQRLNALQEQERAIMKKMNVAIRAGANPTILSQFEFMLQECVFAQQELKMLKGSSGDSEFDNFLSIG